MKKRMGKIVGLIVLVAMLGSLVLTGCGSSDSGGQGTSSDTIKIALAGPQTGGSAEHGTRQRRGALLAVEEVNAAGGINGKMVELVVLDDRADPKEAANIANRLASDPSVLGVIGHANSSCTLAGAPIYNNAGLVHITTSSSSPAISDAGPYTFRLWNSDSYTYTYITEAAIKAGYDKIGIIYENNDYGRGGYEVIKRVLKENGIEPLVEEAYLLGETKDFTSTITKLQNAGVEAVVAVSDETEIALFLTQCKQLDYAPFFASSGTFNPAVLNLGKDAVEGAVGSCLTMLIEPDEKLLAWNQKFDERFKDEGIFAGSDMFAPVAYEAARMLLEAIKEVGEDREAIKDYLTGIKNWEGIFGTVSFDENGDAHLPLTYITIKGGKFVPWSPEAHVK